MAIGDGRYEEPITRTSRGSTKIIFGTIPSRQPKPDQNADHPVELGPVFANDLAIQAISGKSKLFPVGSVLVREKLAKKGDTLPQLLAVMIKRESGFNPAGGDWQFLVTNGSKTKVKLKQKSGECLACHYSAKDTDFVHPLLWVANEQ